MKTYHRLQSHRCGGETMMMLIHSYSYPRTKNFATKIALSWSRDLTKRRTKTCRVQTQSPRVKVSFSSIPITHKSDWPKPLSRVRPQPPSQGERPPCRPPIPALRGLGQGYSRRALTRRRQARQGAEGPNLTGLTRRGYDFSVRIVARPSLGEVKDMGCVSRSNTFGDSIAS